MAEQGLPLGSEFEFYPVTGSQVAQSESFLKSTQPVWPCRYSRDCLMPGDRCTQSPKALEGSLANHPTECIHRRPVKGKSRAPCCVSRSHPLFQEACFLALSFPQVRVWVLLLSRPEVWAPGYALVSSECRGRLMLGCQAPTYRKPAGERRPLRCFSVGWQECSLLAGCPLTG